MTRAEAAAGCGTGDGGKGGGPRPVFVRPGGPGRDAAGHPVLVYVPAPVLDGLTAGQRALLEADWAVAVEAAPKSLSADTTRTYRSQISSWSRWAEERGRRDFPADPADVALHVATAVREHPAGRPTGQASLSPADAELGESASPAVTEAEAEALALATLKLRVDALDRWHEVTGNEPPGDFIVVRDALAAAERDAPPPGKKADALPVEGLKSMLTAADERDHPSVAAARELLLVLATDDRLSAARLAALDRSDGRLVDGGLLLPGPECGVLLARRTDAACPVRAWEALAAVTPGAGADGREGADVPLFAHGGKRYTRQGLTLRAREATLRLGLPVPPKGLPRTGLSALAAALAADRSARPVGPPVEHLSVVRDRLLVPSGFLRGLRPVSVGYMRWLHAVPAPGLGPQGPVVLTVPRSKTDRTGRGRSVFLECTGNPATSPAALFWAYHSRVTDLLGGDPWEIDDGTLPLVLPLRADGTVQRAEDGSVAIMSGAAISDVVRRRATAVELPGRISGASMRPGFVTGLTATGMTAGETAALSGHVTTRSLSVYDRTAPGSIGTAAKFGL